jgi:hypothetical protein
MPQEKDYGFNPHTFRGGGVGKTFIALRQGLRAATIWTVDDAVIATGLTKREIRNTLKSMLRLKHAYRIPNNPGHYRFRGVV